MIMEEKEEVRNTGTEFNKWINREENKKINFKKPKEVAKAFIEFADYIKDEYLKFHLLREEEKKKKE